MTVTSLCASLGFDLWRLSSLKASIVKRFAEVGTWTSSAQLKPQTRVNQHGGRGSPASWTILQSVLNLTHWRWINSTEMNAVTSPLVVVTTGQHTKFFQAVQDPAGLWGRRRKTAAYFINMFPEVDYFLLCDVIKIINLFKSCVLRAESLGPSADTKLFCSCGNNKTQTVPESTRAGEGVLPVAALRLASVRATWEEEERSFKKPTLFSGWVKRLCRTQESDTKQSSIRF